MMIQLNKFDVKLPDDVYLALAITGSFEENGQRHTGFVVKDFSDNSQLFHLGRNNYFRQEELSKSYTYLLIPALEPERANAIASLLVTILQKSKGDIPYSIAWDQDEYFDGEGNLLKTDPVDGFTCATFVLEILKRQGFDIVDRSTWPIDDADSKEWQSKILPLLDLPVECMMAQLELIGKYPRIKPEQAVGAGHIFRGQRICYVEASPAGAEVVVEMRRLRS